MGKLSTLLWGMAIGAGLVYFYDPQNGNRRKAMVRDQVTRLQNQGQDALDMAVMDLRHRVRGLLAEGMAMTEGGNAPDHIIEERVRARLGFLSRHPGAIQVRVQNHRATLTGDILADEVDNLVKGVSGIRGVQDVQNNLKVHQDAGNIPQLQGEGWLPGDNGDMWSPSGRLLGVAGAGYLLLYGMARGGIIGTAARLGGLALGARALTNMNMRQMAGMQQDGGAIRVRKSITINAPVEEVYGLWSNFENFPRFMNNIESIRNTGDGLSHWVVKGPAGSKVEFDAITTQNQPNRMIAWQTTPDSTVKTSGEVRFRQSGDLGTTVNVNMSYTPPAGVAGHAVAALFGKDPKTEMDEDLARMKGLLEEGKTRAKNQKVSREQVMPVTGGQMGESGQQQGRSGGGSGSGRGRAEDSMPDANLDMGMGSDDDDIMPLAPSDQ